MQTGHMGIALAPIIEEPDDSQTSLAKDTKNLHADSDSSQPSDVTDGSPTHKRKIQLPAIASTADLRHIIADKFQAKRAKMEATMHSQLAAARDRFSPTEFRAAQRDYQLQLDDLLALSEGEMLSEVLTALPPPTTDPPSKFSKFKPISKL